MSEEKRKQKPGVRTSLNSGENNVKVHIEKKSSAGKQSVHNPTAEAASKTLPSMKLSTDTNWAEVSSESVLNAVTPASSERSLGEFKAEPPKPQDLPVSNKDRKKHKKVKSTDVEVKTDIVENETKQNKSVKKAKIQEIKLKSQKSKENGNIINDIKSSISNSIDNIKSDYDKLSNITSELNNLKKDLKPAINGNINKLKDYTANTVEKVKNIEMPKIRKTNYDIPVVKDAGKKQIKETDVNIKKLHKEDTVKETRPVNTSNVSSDELKAAAEVSSASAKQKEPDKDITQKLNQAIQKLNGAKTALNALNTQLQFAPKDQRELLMKRIALKEEQLVEAQKIIDNLQQNQ